MTGKNHDQDQSHGNNASTETKDPQSKIAYVLALLERERA